MAQQSRQDVIRLAKRLTPAQRLQAFADHSRLMRAFHDAGENFRNLKNRRLPNHVS